MKKSFNIEKHYCYLAALYTLALVVVFMRPLDVQQWQWADDALYMNNARAAISNLGETPWLGQFNKVVLSKAPFYSVFIASSHSIGVPLRLAEFMLFSILPFLFWVAVRPLGLPKWPVLYIATLCLLFVPTAGMELRLIRTAVFGAMSLYCLTALCGLLIRCFLGEGRKWLWALMAGLAMGLAATTREEAVWLMVPAVLTILASAYLTWRLNKLSNLLFVIPFLVAGYLVPITIFSTLNYKSYDVFAPSLRQHNDFRELYSVLASLDPAQRQKYVPIGTATRHKAYIVSPHFAELKPFLEGAALDHIATNRHHLALNGWGDVVNGREFFVSNFEFALSEAIVLSGRSTGKEFLSFCQEVTKELMFAVESGKIEQGAKGISLLPPIVVSDYVNIVFAAFKSVNYLLAGEGVERNYRLQPNPDPGVALEWHAYLGTWPGLSPGEGRKLTDKIFNKILVRFLGYIYYPITIIGIICLVYLYRVKENNVTACFFMMMISLAALASFNVVMGVVQTIAWPILTWPRSYNSMGFFPLHFLLLISSVVALESLGRARDGGERNCK